MDGHQRSSGLRVIDGDGHVVEPPDLWQSRMDRSRWGDWIPHVDPADGTLYVGGEVRGGGPETLRRVSALSGIPLADVEAGFEQTAASLSRRGGFDPRARLEDMDRDGLDAAVIYPTSGLFFAPLDPIAAVRNPEFALDCQRAYNDWLAEYCDAAPDRLFGIAAAPLQDVDLAVGEVRRAVRDLGLKGVFIRPSPYLGEQPLSDRAYDPFWAACQELGVPVSLHPAVHVDTPGACRKFALVRDDANLSVSNGAVTPELGGSAFGQAIGNAVDMIVTMGRLLMGGVCERFPELTFIFLESGGGWCATQLERMDEQVEAFGLEGRWLSRPPSEYFRRQCYVSFDPGEWNLAASARFIGVERILWASDYPHPEYRSDVVDELMRGIATLSRPDQARVTGTNAIDAYHLPVAVGA
jgi:predicted TIM-barrel fold metal-dependent hydrolase